MAEKPVSSKSSFTLDWLVTGVLTKVGDIVDSLTGRRWKPSSSLATSELIERLKALLDKEARTERGCSFVPHNIKLKMQWDKFSTDSEEGMKKLETELLAAAVDHINDKRYFTHAPLSLEVKPDYFTPGVRILVSFERFSAEEHEAEVNVSVPGVHLDELLAEPSVPSAPPETIIDASFSIGSDDRSVRLRGMPNKRLSVGRTRENDLTINDPSISKFHASLTVGTGGELRVADTGSTNGTYVRGERIAYGKAAVISNGEVVRFGGIDVEFQVAANEISAATADVDPAVRIETAHAAEDSGLSRGDNGPAATEPAITIGENTTDGETV
jgi:hypothetical protein